MILPVVKLLRAIIWLVLGLAFLESAGPAPAEAPDPLTTSILGDWLKTSNGDTITLRSDGTFNGGHWRWIDREKGSFEVDHGRAGAYILTLSADGTRAVGQFTKGPAEKIGKPVELVRKAADALAQSVVGDWVKNGGSVVTLNADGSMKCSDGDGTWQWTNKEKWQFAVSHRRGSSYTLTLSADGTRAVGEVDKGDPAKIGKRIEMVRKSGTPAVVAGPVAGETNLRKPPADALTASDLMKANRSNLVFVTTPEGAGSGFIANSATGTFLITNSHVAAGAKGATFKTLNGTQMQTGAPAAAVGHDIFRMALPAADNAFQIMAGVDENAAIGDAVVVLGNAEGAGVINTIKGKIVGIGPNLVEVDAPFQPGNSGSPIVHLKTGKVVGVATYVTVRKFDSATKEPVKKPIVRRFGYRLDTVRIWQPVNWQTFYAQAAEMESVERLTGDLVAFLQDLGKDGRVSRGAHTNPAIKSRIDQWIEARSKRLSPRDAAMADESLLSFLRVTCQADIAATQPHLTYDYFQRGLDDQQRERKEIADIFAKSIDDLRK